MCLGEHSGVRSCVEKDPLLTCSDLRAVFHMPKKLLIGLVVLLVAFVAIVTLQTGDFRVERSTKIAAPAEAVFANVNDLHRWEARSPWAKMDPEAKLTYDGAPTGVGAIYAWIGNSKVGEGKMTIIESTPSSLLKLRLDFLKPMAATNEAEFTFVTEGTETRVNWAMTGHKNFVSKAMCMVMSMDKMVGGEFEKGLAQLKAITETEAMARK